MWIFLCFTSWSFISLNPRTFVSLLPPIWIHIIRIKFHASFLFWFRTHRFACIYFVRIKFYRNSNVTSLYLGRPRSHVAHSFHVYFYVSCIIRTYFEPSLIVYKNSKNNLKIFQVFFNYKNVPAGLENDRIKWKFN